MPAKNDKPAADIFADDPNAAGNPLALNENTPASPEATPPANGFAIDFTKVDTVQMPVPINLYNVDIVKAEATFAKSSGNPMIALKYRIADGDYEGRTIFDNLVFTQPTGDWNKDYPLRKIRETLEAVGVTAAQAASGIDPEMLLGERVTVAVGIDDIKRNGSLTDPTTGEAYGKQNTIKKVMPYGAAKSVDSIL